MNGTVIKRGKKWSVVIDAGRNAEGKRVRTWHSGYATKKAAEEARVEILSKLQRGEYVPPSKLTVGEWLSTWLDGRQGLAETTIDGYRIDVKRLAGLSMVRLRDLSPTMISDHYKTLEVAPKTVRNTHGVLHKALSDAVKRGVLARNPADHVELPALSGRTLRPGRRTRCDASSTMSRSIGCTAPGCWSPRRECDARRFLV